MNNINIIFVKDGICVTMVANPDIMWAELIFEYTKKVGIKYEDKPQFFYNSKNIVPDSCLTLKELNIFDRSRIDVVLGAAVQGAL